MAAVVLGVVLLALKLLELSPVAAWSWWWVLAPFPVALAWWAWADASGMTKRREMEREKERRDERRKRHIESMGLGPDQRGSTFRRR